MSEKDLKEKISKEEKLARYSRVVDNAQLELVQLLKVSFDVQPDYFAPDADNELSYDIDLNDSRYDAETGVAMAFVECGVTANGASGETLLCTAHYSVIYNLAEECDGEATTAFLRKVAVFACFPYFRSLFANLDWAANTRLPPLPVHKEALPSTKKKKPAKVDDLVD